MTDSGNVITLIERYRVSSRTLARLYAGMQSHLRMKLYASPCAELCNRVRGGSVSRRERVMLADLPEAVLA